MGVGWGLACSPSGSLLMIITSDDFPPFSHYKITELACTIFLANKSRGFLGSGTRGRWAGVDDQETRDRWRLAQLV